MSLSTSILTVSLFSCLQRHTQTHTDCFQVHELDTLYSSVLLGTEGRPPRLHVEPRGLKEGCIESAPLFSQSHPQKGLFPIQDTQGHEIIHTGTSRPHTGGGITRRKTASHPSLCADFSTPLTLL